MQVVFSLSNSPGYETQSVDVSVRMPPLGTLGLCDSLGLRKEARLQSVEGHRGKYSWRRAICATIANMVAWLSLSLAEAGAVSREAREPAERRQEQFEQVTKSIRYSKEIETEDPAVHCEDVSDEMKK